eukprot:660412-Ditylum_brightwellii.AAC.1
MDVGQTNITFAVGKPVASKEHLKACSEEPYGVACIQGIKISMEMHNFGETRFGTGLISDFCSQTEQNTRVVVDFTKSVIMAPIVNKMLSIMTTKPRAADCDIGDVVFENGDNYYLGMEFTREYEVWKYAIVKKIVGAAPNAGVMFTRIWFIPGYTDKKLGSLPVKSNKRQKYEVVVPDSKVLVQSVEGYMQYLPNDTIVNLESDLTR